MEALNDDLPFVLLDEQPVSILYYQPVSRDGSPGSISDFEIVYCNKTAAQLADATAEQLIGNNISTSAKLSEQSKERILQQLLHVYNTGETIHEEYYDAVINKHIHVTLNKIRDGVLTTAKDVSATVALRREQEKQTELATRVLDSALNGWFYCEAVKDEKNSILDFEFLMINPSFTRIAKKEKAEVIGKKYLSLFPTARVNGIHEMNCRVVNEKVVEKRQMHYKGDDLDAWYDVVASPLGDNGLLVTFADITHTKQKEIEAAKYAETLTTVINTVQVGIFTFRPEYNKKCEIVDFRFTMVNPALSSYVAQEPETLMGALGSEWFPGYLHNGVFDMYRETFLTGELQRRQFHYNVDGIDVFLDLQSTRIGDEVLVTFSDFTPLQLAQLELQKSIRELQRSNQNLEEFTRAASHDLKEPIRKIQLFSDRLKHTLGDTINDNARGLFSKMEDAASRMRILIDDLLDYSHVNTVTWVKEQVDLNDIVGQVISDLEIMIEDTEAVVDCDPLPVIEGNKRQVQQLFLNLIHNSIKYRKPDINPHVFIHARTLCGRDTMLELESGDLEKEFVVIEVSDNGIGFDQKDSEKIFHVFTRLHSNTEYDGTGIGLAIANRVMENHSGYIFSSGVKGQGATFTLLFPA